MTLSEIEVRTAEIEVEMRDENIEEEKRNSLESELDKLLEERKAIEAEAEARKAEVEEILNQQNEMKEFKPIETKEERKMFEVDSKEYRSAWLKNMMGKDLSEEERGAITATDTIPTETENRIINRLKENALLKHIDMMHIPGNVTVPVYSTNGDAAWGSSNEQEDVIGKISLNPYQLIKTIEVPATVANMSIDAFESYVIEALGNKIETALQTAVIVGTGVNCATGINQTHSTADGEFTKAGITKKDLMKIMGSLDAKYMQDAVWIMPNAVLFEAMAVADLKGFAGVAEGIGYQIGGKPVIVDDNCIISSTDTIFFGGAKAYHMNLGSDIKVDKDVSVGFKSGAVNYRAMCLADGKLDNADAFVKYTRATA